MRSCGPQIRPSLEAIGTSRGSQNDTNLNRDTTFLFDLHIQVPSCTVLAQCTSLADGQTDILMDTVIVILHRLGVSHLVSDGCRPRGNGRNAIHDVCAIKPCSQRLCYAMAIMK